MAAAAAAIAERFTESFMMVLPSFSDILLSLNLKLIQDV